MIFSSDELEKMAHDEKYAAEKMRHVQTIANMGDRICQEFGYERTWGKNTVGGNGVGVLNKMAVFLNEDGKMSIFAELEKSSAKQREQIEKIREKRTEEKKDADSKEKDFLVKRVLIEAESEDDLYEKIKGIDWDKVIGE